MPFNRPSLTELLDRIKGDINSRLPGADARLRRSVLNVLAYAEAGMTHGLYSYLSFIARQAFPDTAESEFLDHWGSIYSIIRKQAQQASGNAAITGVDGTVVPSGTLLQRSDGVQFVTTNDTTISAGVALMSLESSVGGDKGNTETNTILNFISPPANVSSSATVDINGLTGGTELEDDAAYLERVLARIQFPPSGGAYFDYEAWALAVPGVTRVWVYPLELGPGAVTVRFMMDDTYSDGIPQSGDVAAVQEYIDERRPVTADVTVLAPIADPLNFTIHLNLGDSVIIRAAVQAELSDMIRRDAEPGGTIYLSRINEAISIATGEYDHTLSIPLDNVTHAQGHIATMGSITWI